MAKFAVKVVKRLARTVIVDAESFDEGVDVVREAYDNCDIVLDADDIDNDGAKFIASETFGENPIAEDDERLTYYSTYPAKEA